jgi:uncharacterized protein (TIGR03435 family)
VNNVGNADSSSSSVLPGGRYIASNVTLRDLVRSAYNVANVEIVGGAPWTREMHFDVQARAAGEWTVDHFRTAVRPMLRRLLAERFGLKVHEERRVLEVYALKRPPRGGRLGPRLHAAITDCTPAAPCGAGFNRRGAMSATAVSFSVLVKSLSTWTDRPVIDRTGLSGLFDWDLAWDPDAMAPSASPETGPTGPAATRGVSLFTALREQLGLTLQPTRAEVPVLAIDDAVIPEPD